LALKSKFRFRYQLIERIAAAPVLAILLALIAIGPAVCAEREDSLAELARTVLTGGDATTADFDGDRHGDLALVVPDRGSLMSTRYTVDIKFSTRIDSTSFTLQSRPGGLDVAARDIDGDRDLDLVITTRLSGEHVGVWVNDGSGNLLRGNVADYPSWIWGGGPRLVNGSPAEKSSSAILPPGSSFVLCSLERIPSWPTATRVGYDQPKRVVRPFSGTRYIRPPPQSL
jgi:hypothetical protein